MISTPPRPDGSGEPDESGERRIGAGEVVGSAGRESIADDEVDRAARTYWEAEADTYQAEHGTFLALGTACAVDSDHPMVRIDSTAAVARVGAGFVWGPEGLSEAEAGLLGPVEELAGKRILEVGCGAAQCSAWLAQRGAQAVGIDIAVNQLRHATGLVADLSPQSGAVRTVEGHHGTGLRGGAARGNEGGGLRVVAASATALPLRGASFDAAFASYGAIQFVGDLPRLLAEVRRVLRPGARWVFSVTHPIRWAFPDDPGPAGLVATGWYFDRTPYVERVVTDGTAVYAEFHRTIGDYVAGLRDAGFTIEVIVEPEWPEWNDSTWGGWSPERGMHLPGTLILGCRAA